MDTQTNLPPSGVSPEQRQGNARAARPGKARATREQCRSCSRAAPRTAPGTRPERRPNGPRPVCGWSVGSARDGSDDQLNGAAVTLREIKEPQADNATAAPASVGRGRVRHVDFGNVCSCALHWQLRSYTCGAAQERQRVANTHMQTDAFTHTSANTLFECDIWGCKCCKEGMARARKRCLLASLCPANSARRSLQTKPTQTAKSSAIYETPPTWRSWTTPCLSASSLSYARPRALQSDSLQNGPFSHFHCGWIPNPHRSSHLREKPHSTQWCCLSCAASSQKHCSTISWSCCALVQL